MVMNDIPWTSIFLFTQLFGIRLYSLKRKEECQQIQKKLGPWCSHMSEDGKGYGYSFGYWYFLHVSVDASDFGDRYNIWLIGTEDSYNKLITLEDSSKKVVEELIPELTFDILQRHGSFNNPYYLKRKLKMSIEPMPKQKIIMDEIQESYCKKGFYIVFIHGEPGTGKSMIPLLMANCVKGMYCSTFRPWLPGDTLSSLYNESEPTQTKPLILAFDEVDSALVKIHQGLEQHKNIPIPVADKSGWNHMLDDIQRGLYPHLILILTSNKEPAFINEMDTSYLRERRVDKIFHLEKN
jgi:SpoVK/Ycf46/Vps4 family AAA+-type ATPase